MQLLAFGDPHIKPTGDSVDYDRLAIPDGVDAVVTAGDVVHRTDPDSLAAGRRFLERLDATGVPTFCVPGNHDPVEHYADLLDGLDATLVHESSGTVEGTDGTSLSVVGWGCEQTTFDPEIDATAFSALDPRSAGTDRQYAADRVAGRIEDLAYDLLVDRDPDRPQGLFREAATELEIERSSLGAFERQWRRLCATYDRLSGLFAETPDPTLVVTHVPPYGTDLDVHHSKGNRDVDLDGCHCGSLALKLALREHEPVAALSGHSHRQAYETTPTHLLSLDGQGIVRVHVDPDVGSFGYQYLHE